MSKSKQIHEKESQAARLLVPDGYSPEDVKDISSVLNALVADAFALYLKTKNFHWHMNGQHSATTTFSSTNMRPRYRHYRRHSERVRKVAA